MASETKKDKFTGLRVFTDGRRDSRSSPSPSRRDSTDATPIQAHRYALRSLDRRLSNATADIEASPRKRKDSDDGDRRRRSASDVRDLASTGRSASFSGGYGSGYDSGSDPDSPRSPSSGRRMSGTGSSLSPMQPFGNANASQSAPPSSDSKMDDAGFAREAGTQMMGAKRRQNIDSSFLAYAKKPDKKKNIRIKAIMESGERWGVSADENVSTRLLNAWHAGMKPEEREAAYYQREHQGVLIWRTGSEVVTSLYDAKARAKDPLTGHTPTVKREIVAGTKGALTSEHGKRDKLRESAVRKTYEDSNRGVRDVAIMANLATIQIMMEPRESLLEAKDKVTKGRPVHSVFANIGDISKPANFEIMASTVQEAREHRKMYSAVMLHRAGYDHLVPQSYQQLLGSANWDPVAAFNTQRNLSGDASKAGFFNTAKSTQTDPLNAASLREMNASMAQGTRHRALSDPRLLPSVKPKDVKW